MATKGLRLADAKFEDNKKSNFIEFVMIIKKGLLEQH